jgi:ribosomal protein RSM22 (predicted rRNA methylase)
MSVLELPEIYLKYLERKISVSLNDFNPAEINYFSEPVFNLSQRFIKKTSDAPAVYLDHETYRKAYLLYYTTANLLKIYYPLNELHRGGFFADKPALKILDLATGTGSTIWGLLTWLSESKISAPSIHVTMCDQSRKSLNDLQNDLPEYFPDTGFLPMYLDLEKRSTLPEKYDLIIGGNFLSELTVQGVSIVKSIIHQHLTENGYCVLIEPAQRDSSRALLQFRDDLLADGWTVYAPCCTQKPCPALENPKDWCHHELNWERPKFIEIIDEQIGTIKRSLKFSYMIFSGQDRNVSDYQEHGRDFSRRFRCVSELFDEKGRYRVILCNDLGRVVFQKNKRDDTETNHSFNRLNRYDIVYIENAEIRNTLGKIGKNTNVRII